VIAIAKPGDIIIVQVSEQWTPNMIRGEQHRLSSLTEDGRIPVEVIVVPGGPMAPSFSASPEVKTG
jgi:hypothetical protein